MIKTIDKIKDMVTTEPQYRFLKENEHLGSNVIMLGLGGSYAYGTMADTSDVDIRGVAIPRPHEILLGKDFEQVTDTPTDTVVYSLKKMFTLMANCNPNTIEILGLSQDQILHKSKYWDMVLEHKDAFLSRRAINAFGGYATAQLRRLQNREARIVGQAQREKHILNSIGFAEQNFRQKLPAVAKSGTLRLYIDKSDKEDMDTEIFADVNATHFPLRDYCALINGYNAVVRDYDKLGKRNSKAIEHGKISKHMMHLVRLYLMCFDILEKQEINTYRKDDIPFLMEIRNGKFLNNKEEVLPEFYELVDEYEKRLKLDANETSLPAEPDRQRIEDMLHDIHLDIVWNSLS